MPDDRRPAALLSEPIARLVGFALLAGLGALQWARLVDGASQARALVWVAAGVVAALLVLAGSRAPARWRPTATAAGALAGVSIAFLVSGLDLEFLRPRHWPELWEGLSRGAEALGSVRLPYIGRDPWVLATVEVTGAVVCALAGVAVTWPEGRTALRVLALALLLVLAASPVVSLGGDRPGLLGGVIALVTACFLWLERLPVRPGIGAAVLAAGVLVVALPLGAAADRETPWFDYKAFAEGFGSDDPVRFSWDHGYGPIDWSRDGAELFRVRRREADGALYWKADVLNDFDGREWRAGSSSDPGGDRAVDDLAYEWRDHSTWNVSFEVSIRRLVTPTVIGAGTILDVDDSSRPVERGGLPGVWVAQGARNLRKGDSYEIRAHVPQPTATQMAAATVADPRRTGALELPVQIREDELDRAPRTGPSPVYPQGQPVSSAVVNFPPFPSRDEPSAHYIAIDEFGSGDDAMRWSDYDRTWALAKRLRRSSTSPYDYVVNVNNFLRGPDFEYSEVPAEVPRGEAPLEHFLFDGRLGYCQHFSGAMALLLRMGGVPARVVAGFSPGGFRRRAKEWVVRDTDAHSWVEAWFDGLGWVTFDPTPPATPARSQIAAIAPPEPTAEATATASPGPEEALDRPPEGPQRPVPTATAAEEIEESAGGGGRSSLWTALPIAALVALAGSMLWLARRRERPADAIAELERALRRSGRDLTPGMTLVQLERRLGASGEAAGYLRGLRAARFGTGAGPTPEQRAAFRRELAAGLGWRGRLRALWALPPILRIGRTPR